MYRICSTIAVLIVVAILTTVSLLGEGRPRWTEQQANGWYKEQPKPWFHEVFKHDDTLYRQSEVDLIHQLTGRGTTSGPKDAQEQKV